MARSTKAANGERIRWTNNGKYWFDKFAADQACAFFPRYLRFTDGEWAGQPFTLQRWQRRIVRKLFGWKRADGTRRYRRLWLELPRGNGKTEFAAGLALLLLIADGEPSPQIFAVASEEGQARIVFARAAKMVSMSPELLEIVEVFKTSLWCTPLQGFFRPFSASADSKQGYRASGLIGDEVHVWKSGETAEVVHEGEGTRRQPLDIFITTAGVIGSYAHEQHEYAIAVVAGEIEDDEIFVVIFAAGDDADWTDPEAARRANPNYDISVKPEFLASERRKARNQPRLQNRYRRFSLNQWVEQVSRWIPMESWDLCTSAPSARAIAVYLADEDLDDELRAKALAKQATVHDPDLWKTLRVSLRGRSCSAGLDLATVRDLAAWVMDFPPLTPGGPVTLLSRFWYPAASLKLLSAEDKKRYERFVEQGALTLTPGNVTDYAYIKRDILQDAEEYRIGLIGIDRDNATQLAVELRGDEGLNAEFFGQGFRSMSAPSKDFERLFLSLALEHGNHPVLHWMAKNVAVDTDAHDNIKPIKPSTGKASKAKKQAAKVDGIVAAIMARGIAMAGKAETKVSVYETRGLRTL